MNTNLRLGWTSIVGGALLAGASLVPGLALAADAGKVIDVAGGASMVRDGKTLNLKAGTTLRSGDVLVTGGDGTVQWQTADEGLGVLAPNSRFAIQDYSYQGGGGQAQYEIKSGGYGSVSGMIKSPGYKVVTPAADITIEGTKFKSILCSGNCGDLPDGTYVSVVEGSVTLSNGAGSASGTAGQYLYASGRDSAPRLVDRAPDLLASLTFNFDFEFDADGLADLIERRLSPS